MLQISAEIRKDNPILLCIAGNMCSPQVAFEKIDVPKGVQKIELDYLKSPGPWDMRSKGNELAELIESLAPTPVILAGYSAGGVLAMSAASKVPDAIAGLILSNTGPCSIGHGHPGFAEELKARANDESYMRKFLSSCFYTELPKETEDRLWEYARTVNPEAGYGISKSIREVDYREPLKKFSNPVAVIHGSLDNRRKMDSVERMKQCMPQAKITLLQTGHTPMWEDPKGYKKAMLCLMEEALGSKFI